MRISFFWFTTLILLLALGCEKDNQDQNLDQVEEFYQGLIAGTYQEGLHFSLPPFAPEHIPALLMHSGDTNIVTGISNPISSYHLEKIPIGYIMLWTIENIRIHYPKYTGEGGFPSQNPVIIRKEDSMIRVDQLTLLQIDHVYFQWWSKGRTLNFDQLRTLNPLEETGLTWK